MVRSSAELGALSGGLLISGLGALENRIDNCHLNVVWVVMSRTGRSSSVCLKTIRAYNHDKTNCHKG